jgi:hypothetical protein
LWCCCVCRHGPETRCKRQLEGLVARYVGRWVVAHHVWVGGWTDVIARCCVSMHAAAGGSGGTIRGQVRGVRSVWIYVRSCEVMWWSAAVCAVIVLRQAARGSWRGWWHDLWAGGWWHIMCGWVGGLMWLCVDACCWWRGRGHDTWSGGWCSV